MKKRIVSLLLALVMVLSLVPATVWAAENHDGQVRVIVENTTYAKANGMQFSLEKEGMYPEFSLDGIPYKAYRNPGKYRDEICCDAVHPEQLDTGLPPRREKLLRIARIVLPPVCTFAAIMAAGWVVTGGAGWLWLAALASGGVLLGRCMEKWL